MAATVLLLHELPDGTRHYDWMLKVEGCADPGRPLATFRVSERIDLAEGRVEGGRIGDHREAYLTFEGDIGQGRGRVTRMARGQAVIESITGTDLAVTVRWDGGTHRRYTGSASTGGCWVFDVAGV